MDKIYREVIDKFKKYHQVKVLRCTSRSASKFIEDNSLDFVYVDGDHSYECVYQDLRLYYKKLRKGGILAGDDYFWGIFEGMPVRRAVSEFANNKGIRAKIIGTQFVFKKQ